MTINDKIKELKQVKITTDNPVLKQTIQDKINALKGNKEILK